MCGRFLLTSPIQIIRELARLARTVPLHPRYNIAPGQPVAMIREAGAGAELTFVLWGLIPFWAQSPDIGARLINARAETIADKPAFRGPVRYRRALIPADGFYEWRGRRPFVFRRRDRVPLLFAAVWESWRDIETMAIVTVAANGTVRPIHERMPALVISPAEQALWLNPHGELVEALAVLRPAPDELLDMVEVGRRVNSADIDDPQCLEPPNGQPSLF